MYARKWRVYYDDGSTSDGPDVEVVRGEGVILILQADADPEDHPYTRGVDRVMEKDFYWWEHARWLGGDLCGLFDYLRRPGWKKVLAGRTVTSAQYHRIKSIADSDAEFFRV